MLKLSSKKKEPHESLENNGLSRELNRTAAGKIIALVSDAVRSALTRVLGPRPAPRELNPQAATLMQDMFRGMDRNEIGKALIICPPSALVKPEGATVEPGPNGDYERMIQKFKVMESQKTPGLKFKEFSELDIGDQIAIVKMLKGKGGKQGNYFDNLAKDVLKASGEGVGRQHGRCYIGQMAKIIDDVSGSAPLRDALLESFGTQLNAIRLNGEGKPWDRLHSIYSDYMTAGSLMLDRRETFSLLALKLVEHLKAVYSPIVEKVQRDIQSGGLKEPTGENWSMHTWVKQDGYGDVIRILSDKKKTYTAMQDQHSAREGR